MDIEGFQIPVLHALVVSVSVGALIGLMRQWSDLHESPENESSAGLRTHALWSLLGFLSGFLHDAFAAFFYPVAFATFGIFLIAANSMDRKEDHRKLGLTSYASAILTFLVGSLVFWQQFQVAMVTAVIVGILIPSKPFIHRWTENLKNEDMLNLLQFLAVTGLILPLVPNQGYGPFQAFNPFQIWLMVVLISGFGFAGYIFMRLLGAKAGITATGLAGGLASSTATTIALTRASRQNPGLSRSLATGILLANTVLFIRIALLVLTLNQQLLLKLLVPFLVITAPTSLFLARHLLSARKEEDEVDIPELRNPLSLRVALQFALVYALIVFLVKAVHGWVDEAVFYPVAFLSGLTQMDAISLSLTNETSHGNLSLELAARGILVAGIANTLLKTGFAVCAGHPQLRGPVLLGMLPMIAAGTIGCFLI